MSSTINSLLHIQIGPCHPLCFDLMRSLCQIKCAVCCKLLFSQTMPVASGKHPNTYACPTHTHADTRHMLQPQHTCICRPPLVCLQPESTSAASLTAHQQPHHQQHRANCAVGINDTRQKPLPLKTIHTPHPPALLPLYTLCRRNAAAQINFL